MQKKYLPLLILTIFIFILPPLPASAEEASSSSSSTETAITNNLKKRIQKTLQTVKENLVTTAHQPTAYLGQVEDIIQQTIKIHTPQDEIKYAHLDNQTIIIRNPANRQIKLKDIRLEDKIISLGYTQANEPDTLMAKRIIVSEKLSFTLNKTSGIAKIVTKTRHSLTIQPLGSSNKTIQLNFNNATVVKNQDQVLDLTDLKPDQTIVYTAILKTPTPLATIIMLIN